MAIVYKPVAGDVLEVSVYCDSVTLQQVSVNVLHYVVDSTADGGATQDEIAAAMDGFFAPLYKPCLSTSASYFGLIVQKIWPLPVVIDSAVKANTGVGTGGVGLAPAQLCGLITKFTALAGPRYRGRVYCPFPPPAFIDAGGRATGAYQAVMNTLGGTLFFTTTVVGAVGSTTYSPVLYSRTTHLTQHVQDAFARPKVATQRRRGEYGRQNTIPPF